LPGAGSVQGRGMAAEETLENHMSSTSRRHRPLRLHAGRAAALVLAGALLPLPAMAELYVTIVQGLGGMPEYDERFTEQRERVTNASLSMTAEDLVKVFSGEEATRESVLAHF